jgi:hypothetical protein
MSGYRLRQHREKEQERADSVERKMCSLGAYLRFYIIIAQIIEFQASMDMIWTLLLLLSDLTDVGGSKT